MESKRPKTMLEKLTSHYEATLKMGNGGHVVVYPRDNLQEIIRPYYIFPKGKFTLKSRNDTFFRWDYDIR